MNEIKPSYCSLNSPNKKEWLWLLYKEIWARNPCKMTPLTPSRVPLLLETTKVM
jgi:hypothetical protein